MGKIYAVIISYNGGTEAVATVASVRAQVSKVIVVDNGSAEPTLKVLEELEHTASISLIRLPENVGIARAQNIGIDMAGSEGADWILTLDQDSQCAPGMVAEMVAAAESVGHDKVGFCCPVVQYKKSADSANAEMVDGRGVDRIAYAISSGCLFPMATLQQAGPQREDYFIDSVDFEYSLRLTRNGYQLLRVRTAVLGHKLGTKKKIKILGLTLALSVHSPFRRYYVMRNHIFLAREYWRYAPLFIFKKTCFLCLLLLQIFFFEERKLDNMKNLWAGLIDGLKGRGGKRPAELPA